MTNSEDGRFWRPSAPAIMAGTVHQPLEMADSPLTQTTISRRSMLRGSAMFAGLALAGPVLAACGSSSSSASAASRASSGKTTSKTIGMSLNGLVEYDKQVVEGAAKTLAGSGYNLKVAQANFSNTTELANLHSLIDEGVAGLIILPNTIDNVLTAVKTAHSQNIPSSMVLWAVPDVLDPYLAGVAYLDSIAGGSMIGNWLKANAKPGKVIVVEGVLGQGFSGNLNKGLDAAVAGTGFQVVVRQQGLFSRTTAISIVQNALQAHPDAKIIVDYAAVMGNGIASYLKQQNITDITHVTSDGDPNMLPWFGTPYLAASRYYSAAQTGRIGAQVVLDALAGRKPTFKNPVFQTMMTAQNKDQILAKDPLDYPQYASAVNRA